jgi:RNA polymerase sigma-70 factor (ECF subfamily)
MADPLSDPEWLKRERAALARARAGDAEGLAEIYRTLARPLYARVLLPRLGDPQLAKEALSDTFRTLIERLAEFEDRGAGLWPWLSRIARHRAIDLLRARTRGTQALSRLETEQTPLPEQPDVEAELGALEQMARRKAEIASVLGTIHPRYRRVLELRFLEQRERAECAAALAVTVATFDVLLLRALRGFRKAYLSRFGEAADD